MSNKTKQSLELNNQLHEIAAKMHRIHNVEYALSKNLFNQLVFDEHEGPNQLHEDLKVFIEYLDKFKTVDKYYYSIKVPDKNLKKTHEHEEELIKQIRKFLNDLIADANKQNVDAEGKDIQQLERATERLKKSIDNYEKQLSVKESELEKTIKEHEKAA